MEPRKGWCVSIKRKDGSSFMCSSMNGDATPVWAKRNRKYAVEHKKMLRRNGFNARVVPVLFTDPIIIE